MPFEIENKVALITGGASGLGFKYAQELLRNGAKGVTLADINSEVGIKALEDIDKSFGPNKAIFVKTDVTNYDEFEAAFKETIKKFKNVDILINNAGILNDAIWEKELLINVNGTINGTRLGIDKYLPKYKQDEEALILNVSSVAGTFGFGPTPVYCASKYAILGLINSWGIPEFYKQSKVRVIGILPGVTVTPLMTEIIGRNFGGRYDELLKQNLQLLPSQKPEFVAKEVMKVIKFAPNGTSWVIEAGEPAYRYVVPDRTTMKGNLLPTE